MSMKATPHIVNISTACNGRAQVWVKTFMNLNQTV